MTGYKEDLTYTYIHGAGYTDFVRKAAPALLGFIRRSGFRRGLVVDLGCGSGDLARELIGAGYDVLG